MTEPPGPRHAEWERLAKAATPGPWVSRKQRGEVNDTSETREHVHIKVWSHVAGDDDFDRTEADADFIAAAREAVPALLSEVSVLSRENQQLREQLSALGSHHCTCQRSGHKLHDPLNPVCDLYDPAAVELL